MQILGRFICSDSVIAVEIQHFLRFAGPSDKRSGKRSPNTRLPTPGDRCASRRTDSTTQLPASRYQCPTIMVDALFGRGESQTSAAATSNSAEVAQKTWTTARVVASISTMLLSICRIWSGANPMPSS